LDRCALFVDASYALSEGALAVHGTRNRDSVSWDYAGLLKLLGGLSRDRTGLPLLRCYWYDAATDGDRAEEHEALADIPGVKLRLHKLRPNRKEGVEAEIRKDLTALARNRAVSDVIIVSAEEDLAPVIAEIQDQGVRAILLHVTSDGDWAVSRSLRQECDDIIDISPGHLRPYVDLISGAEPQLTTAGYREIAASTSAPHPAIEAAPARLYASPIASEYERAEPQLAGLAGTGQDLPRFPDARPAPVSESAAAQHPAEQQQHYQAAEAGQRGLPPVPGHGQAPAGYLPDGYAGQDQARGQGVPGGQPQNGLPHNGLPHNGQLQNGQPAGGQLQNGFGHRLEDDGRGRVTGGAGIPAQAGPGSQNGMPAGPGLPGLSSQSQPNGMPGGLSGAGPAGHGQPANGVQPNGQPGNGVLPGGLPSNGVPGGLPGNGMLPGNLPPSGLPVNGQPGNPMQPGRMPPTGLAGNGLGQQPHGLPGAGAMQQQGLPPQGMQPPGLAQGGGAHSGGSQPGGQGGAPSAAAAPGGLPPNGGYQNPGRPAGIPQQGPPLPAGLPPYGQAMPGSGQRPAVPGGGAPQNGLLAPDHQRQQRPLPPAEGGQYPPDRGLPYGGQVQPVQYGAPQNPGSYAPNPYAAPPPVVQPAAAMSVGDAVQSAHAEGFGFGEAVARDAPALWLEAVLARKPRMPSDLEARLLQGSALPIDSLLHDEVRHALRRGFWDALERSRH
jgi:hypothetical protein